MLKQLNLFQEEIDYAINDIVNCNFTLGRDIKQNIVRCYTGGNYGFVLSIDKQTDKAIVFFPSRVEPELQFINEEWFEFDSSEVSKVTTYGFDEEEFRKLYSPKNINGL
jgi:hypothetical protein